MTADETFRLLELLAVNYHRELSQEPDMVALWTIALASYPADAVRQAAIEYMTSERGRWWPTLADVLSPLHHQAASDVDQAWGAVVQQVRAVGRYGTPTFADPAVREAVQALGWSAICDAKPDAIRQQFFQAYREIQTRRRGHAAAAPLLRLLRTAGGFRQAFDHAPEGSSEALPPGVRPLFTPDES